MAYTRGERVQWDGMSVAVFGHVLKELKYEVLVVLEQRAPVSFMKHWPQKSGPLTARIPKGMLK